MEFQPSFELIQVAKFRCCVFFRSIWYGFIPWQWYEDECHYTPITYFEHAVCNLRHAWRCLWWPQSELEEIERTLGETE